MLQRQAIGWHRLVATRFLIVLSALVLAVAHGSDAVFAPNHFLGTCLDDAWVANVEAKLGISAQQRDALGRLVHPFLHAALRETRFHVDDPRTANSRAFTELPEGAALYGVNATVNAVDGTVLDAGAFNRSLVVELNGWTTHSLATLVFSILAREVYGYAVAHLLVTDTLTITQRMSSVLGGASTPTHVNLEVWIAGIQSNLQVYANESFAAGGLGYFGRSGLYTSVDFIRDSLPLFANFWKSYEIHEQLIGAVPVSSLRSSKFFPPKEVACADNSFGCLNHCAKTHACTLREQATPSKECMVVAMMYDYYDPGYLQAVLANLNVAAYLCFLGYDGLEAFVVDAQKRRQPVLFYHFEPDLFHFRHSGLFDRVFLPRSTPERVALATGTFGERGYGKPTDNPVDVDFPSTKLSKYASSHIRNDAALVQLVTQFSLSELDINDLLRKYLQATSATTTKEPDPTFRAACEWVKENYATWSLWLERLPECTFETHVQYDITGCVDDEDEEIDPGTRTIAFRWRIPHPDNVTWPYDCDGGLTELPHAIFTSRSCEWLKRDPSRWADWVDAKPECDRQFYKYTISACNANAKRMIRYAWHLPDPANPTQSLECAKGDSLPRSIEEECDYMPYASPVFVSIATADGILAAVIVLATVFVFVERNAAVIKRSQYELLLLILAGGLLVCVAILLYAGPPTPFLCGARPLFMSAGFTTIFGALLVKSLRVYRVFMRAGFNKNTVKLASVIRVFVAIFAVDLLIIAAWYTMDFPAPTTTLRRSVKFDGYVTDLVCASSSFLFTAMMFFWKAIVLFVGLYISFLIRNVSSDFQESLWTFAACLVVLVGCVVVLPIAYIVDLAAAPFFVFLATVLLICTTLVISVMMVPKIWRLRASPTVGVVRSSLSDNGLQRHGPRSARSLGRAGADMSELTDGNSNNDEQREPEETTLMGMTPVMPMAGGSPGTKPVSRTQR